VLSATSSPPPAPRARAAPAGGVTWIGCADGAALRLPDGAPAAARADEAAPPRQLNAKATEIRPREARHGPPRRRRPRQLIARPRPFLLWGGGGPLGRRAGAGGLASGWSSLGGRGGFVWGARQGVGGRGGPRFSWGGGWGGGGWGGEGGGGWGGGDRRSRVRAERRLAARARLLHSKANETTAAALSWAIAQGAAHPDAWAACAPTRQQLDGFIAETMRLTPAVWGVPRTASRAGMFGRGFGRHGGAARAGRDGYCAASTATLANCPTHCRVRPAEPRLAR